jgi:hypothetical protein
MISGHHDLLQSSPHIPNTFQESIPMFRVVTRLALVTGLGLSAVALPASAQSATTNPVKCAGAAQHKAAQAARLQAIQSEIAALNERRAAVVASGRKPERIARIDARIAQLQANAARVTANQAKFAARCP